MKTTEIFQSGAKAADDYSEIEMFRLAEKIGNNPSREIIASIINDEVKNQNLISSTEEGMKLLKMLSSYKMYSLKGQK
jgi:hypothetical protein